jgi:hypothetical protein
MATPNFPLFTCDSGSGPDGMWLQDYNEIVQTRPFVLDRGAADPRIQRRKIAILTMQGEYDAYSYQLGAARKTFYALDTVLFVFLDVSGLTTQIYAPYQQVGASGWKVERRQEHYEKNKVVKITFQLRDESIWTIDPAAS